MIKGDRGIQGKRDSVWCFIKYHVSEDRSSIVELAGCVGTLRCVSAYHEPAWHFVAKLVDDEGQEMANVQKATGHGHF